MRYILTRLELMVTWAFQMAELVILDNEIRAEKKKKKPTRRIEKLKKEKGKVMRRLALIQKLKKQ